MSRSDLGGNGAEVHRAAQAVAAGFHGAGLGKFFQRLGGAQAALLPAQVGKDAGALRHAAKGYGAGHARAGPKTAVQIVPVVRPAGAHLPVEFVIRAVAALEGAYEREVAAYDYARSLIPGQYRDARNRTDAAAALARQSVNEQFAASGLNTGAAGQARLSMAIANQGALSRLDSEQAAALAELDMRRAEAESEYRSAVAEAIASSELERAQALYEEAVRVDASYRAYSEEMLAAWGLTLAGTPIVTEEPVSAGSYGGGGASAHSTGKQSSGAAATGASEAELLRQQLSRIPGLTRENKAAMIQDYYANGRISYDDMQSLLAGV